MHVETSGRVRFTGCTTNRPMRHTAHVDVVRYLVCGEVEWVGIGWGRETKGNQEQWRKTKKHKANIRISLQFCFNFKFNATGWRVCCGCDAVCVSSVPTGWVTELLLLPFSLPFNFDEIEFCARHIALLGIESCIGIWFAENQSDPSSISDWMTVPPAGFYHHCGEKYGVDSEYNGKIMWRKPHQLSTMRRPIRCQFILHSHAKNARP